MKQFFFELLNEVMNPGFVMGEERATGLPCRQGESLLQGYIKLFFGGVVLFFVSFFFSFHFLAI